ncbi:SAV_2336 N-terminal domain-related protein [Streptomyces anulatus]
MERVTGLNGAVSAIGAVAPGLDGTALAEALWLASRIAADSASPAPEEPAPASAEAPARTGPSVQRLPHVGDFVRQSPPTPPENRSARPLHERLPGSTGRVPGDAVAVPRTTALPLALEMTRALRPWKRPWRTGRRQALDLDATVAGYARSGELIPVFAPAPERWFDLVLVVDRSPSMQVWRETVSAFAGLLDRLGAFRTLQVRDLTVDPEDGVGLTDRQGLPTSTGQLGSPDGRRLIVVVSDCAAPAWRAPEIWQQLRAWAGHEPVALLNPLPPKLWRRTGLDLPTVRVSPDAPGTGNTGLRFRLPPLLAVGEADPGEWLALPVLSLSPHALGRWSRTVMLAAPEGCSAALIPPSAARLRLARAVPLPAEAPRPERTDFCWWDWPYPCHTRPRCPSPPPRSAERGGGLGVGTGSGPERRRRIGSRSGAPSWTFFWDRAPMPPVSSPIARSRARFGPPTGGRAIQRALKQCCARPPLRQQDVVPRQAVLPVMEG